MLNKQLKIGLKVAYPSEIGSDGPTGVIVSYSEFENPEYADANVAIKPDGVPSAWAARHAGLEERKAHMISPA